MAHSIHTGRSPCGLPAGCRLRGLSSRGDTYVEEDPFHVALDPGGGVAGCTKRGAVRAHSSRQESRRPWVFCYCGPWLDLDLLTQHREERASEAGAMDVRFSSGCQRGLLSGVL